MEKLNTFLAEFPVNIEINVQWGEMDAAQHVNNIIYLRWTENARVEYFGRVGWDVKPEDGRIGFILGWHDCKYIFPVTFPDTVVAGIKCTEIKKDRLMIETHIFSKRHQRLAAISKQTIVTYDYSTLQKADVPEELKNRILAIKPD